jgi:hypothetical protein
VERSVLLDLRDWTYPGTPNALEAIVNGSAQQDIMMPITRLSAAAAAALALSVLAGAPTWAQQPMAVQQVDTPQRRAMQQCVSGVLARLARAKATYREVSPAVAQHCDSQLRAVLAAEIQAGRAGPCTAVENCLDMARGEAGQRATMEFQRQSIR